MEGPANEDQPEYKVISEVIFPVPFSREIFKENIIINTKLIRKAFREKIISQAFKLHSDGRIKDAAKYYQYLDRKSVV